MPGSRSFKKLRFFKPVRLWEALFGEKLQKTLCQPGPFDAACIVRFLELEHQGTASFLRSALPNAQKEYYNVSW